MENGGYTTGNTEEMAAILQAAIDRTLYIGKNYFSIPNYEVVGVFGNTVGLRDTGESTWIALEGAGDILKALQSNGNGRGSGQVLKAGFGFSEGLGSLELAIAGLKPTFDRAAHFGRSNGRVGKVPLYLIKNIFKSPLLENNKALFIGRVGSGTAIRTANVLSKAAPAVGALGVATNLYDIVQDGQLTAGDGFQAVNTGLMIAFPVYGVIYGVVDLGFVVFSDQSSDRSNKIRN